MIINKIRTLFYSKETKKVDELFPTRSNVLNSSSDIEFDGVLYFNGTVNGNITCKNLKAGSRSLITGNINSDNVFVLGEVRGDIEANRVAIGSSAVVHGKISYNSISIEPNAKILGNYFKRKSKRVSKK
tara:strand:- start:893 stop:1279 length:387 start_codon:yes stop_codon:yes gene_type:complete